MNRFERDPSAELNLPNFIRDQAALRDFFGSHQRVADAIVKTIQHAPQIRVIGLLGPWGSGKSTVLRLVQIALEKDTDPGTRSEFFVYDAWLHQSDPPRRSFLEALIAFLDRRGLTTKSAWTSELDRLNRRAEEHEIRTTPTLTLSGRSIVASLLFFPVGLQLIGSGWTGKEIGAYGLTISAQLAGLIFLCLPVFTAFMIYLSWRPTLNVLSRSFFSTKNWRQNRDGFEESSVFALFVNKSVDRVKNRIIKSPDPTAMEFQETFRRLLLSISQSSVKIVFVIDNLDRLPESEAVSLWATIRSFFLDARKSARRCTPLRPL